MKHFPLIVNTDFYVNESSKSAFRNQYRNPLSFQETFKSGWKYLPTQLVYLPLGCSQAHRYVTMRRCSNVIRRSGSLCIWSNGRNTGFLTSPIQHKTRAHQRFFANHEEFLSVRLQSGVCKAEVKEYSRLQVMFYATPNRVD